MTWPSKPHSIPPLKDPRPIESIAKLFRVELSAKGVGLYEIPAVHGIEKPVAGVEVAKINSELSIKDGSSPKIKLVVSREPALKENDAADLDGAWYLFEGATLATLLPNKYPTKAPRKQPICEPPSLSTLCDRGLQALSLKMAELETYTLENPLELPPKEEEGILRDGIREEDEETFKGVELVKVVFEDGGVGVFVDSGTCLTESR